MNDDFLLIHKEPDNGFVHVLGWKNNKKVHIHIHKDNYHLYENTELDDDLMTIINYYYLELNGLILNLVRGNVSHLI